MTKYSEKILSLSHSSFLCSRKATSWLYIAKRQSAKTNVFPMPGDFGGGRNGGDAKRLHRKWYWNQSLFFRRTGNLKLLPRNDGKPMYTLGPVQAHPNDYLSSHSTKCKGDIGGTKRFIRFNTQQHSIFHAYTFNIEGRGADWNPFAMVTAVLFHKGGNYFVLNRFTMGRRGSIQRR